MKNIFLDTNVVIDYLSDRGSFSNASTELFDLYANNNQKVYIAAVSYTNIYYILSN
jgi:predicted nucleic acid-binding protein